MRWIIVSLIIHGLIFVIPFSLFWHQREDVEIRLSYKFKEIMKEDSEKRKIQKNTSQDLKTDILQKNIFVKENTPMHLSSIVSKDGEIVPRETPSSFGLTGIRTLPLSPMKEKVTYYLEKNKEKLKSFPSEPLPFNKEPSSNIFLHQKKQSHFLPSSLPNYLPVELREETPKLSKSNFSFVFRAQDTSLKRRKEVSFFKKIPFPYFYSPIRNNQEVLIGLTGKISKKENLPSLEIDFEKEIPKINNNPRIIFSSSLSYRKQKVFLTKRDTPGFTDFNLFPPKITVSLERFQCIEKVVSAKKTSILNDKLEEKIYSIPLKREKIRAQFTKLFWVEPEKRKIKKLLSTNLIFPLREGEKKEILFLPSSLIDSMLPIDKHKALFPSTLPPPSRNIYINENNFSPLLSDSSSFDEYLKTVLKIIEKNKKYPVGARKRGEEGKLKLNFTLLKTGEVQDVKIINLSNYPELNKATEKLIWELSPFPPFPAGVEKKKITLIVEVIYELKKNS